MPNPPMEVAREGASPDAPALGPYETAYDVRRGYDRPGPGQAPAALPAPEPVYVGRRRNR